MWKVVRHEEQGRSHKDADLPCQDKTFTLVKNSVYSIALADGAGSCKYSHMGSLAVSQKVCKLLCEKFDDLYELSKFDIAKKVMSSCILHLKDRYKNMNCSIKDFSSTLLFVAVKNDKYIVGHIGDGVIGYRHNDRVEVLSYPQNGEYLNSTYFITDTNAIDKFNIFKGNMEDISGFILMSDGVAESLYNRKNNSLSKATNIMLDWLDSNLLKDVENAIRINFNNLFLKRTADDCSIVLMKDVNIENIIKVGDMRPYLNYIVEVQRKTGKKKYINKIESILKSLSNHPKSKKVLSREVFIKEKYIGSILKDMYSAGIIRVKNNTYYLNK